MTRTTERKLMPKTQQSTKDSLLNATLRIVAGEGMRAVTHRKVAAEAGVSLSATSYHLSNMDSILLESMEHYVDVARRRYEEGLATPTTSEEMVEALMQFIRRIHQDSAETTVMYELYAQAARDSRYKELLERWSQSFIDYVCMLYPPDVAAMALAINEGAIFLRHLTTHPLSEDQIRRMLHGVLDGHEISPSRHGETRDNLSTSHPAPLT